MIVQRNYELLVAAEKGANARRNYVLLNGDALENNPYSRVGNFGKKLSAAWHNAWVAENKLMAGN